MTLLIAENWPGWRGPSSNGVSGETKVPTDWSPDRGIAWKTTLPGRGSSSPIVWGDTIFLTAEIEGETVPDIKPPVHFLRGNKFRHPDSVAADRIHRLLAIAVNAKTGAILWQRTAYEGLVYDEHHKKANHAAPTPVTDGKYVYFYFGSGGLYAYDFAGKLAWSMSPGKLGTEGLGTGASPAMDANRVYLQCDQDEGEGSFVVAVDKETGKTVWRKERKSSVSWSSPLVLNSELLTAALDSVVAYNPSNGEVLWRTGGLNGNAVPSITYTQGMAFFSTGYPLRHTLAVKMGGSGEVKPEWEYAKGTGYVPSGIAYGDFVYLITDKGILSSLDAKTGKVHYDNGRPPVPATYSASPVAFDGKLVLTSEDGDSFVVKAGPAFEILAKNSVGEPVYASPAISGGTIYIRGEAHLFAIR